MEVLKKIQKFAKDLLERASMIRISKRLIGLLLMAVLLLLKLYSKSLIKIPKIPISQLLSPLNLQFLKKVKVYPNQIIALDSLNNLTRSSIYGVPQSILYQQLNKQGISLQYASQPVGSSKIDAIIFLLSLFASFLVYYLYRKNGERTSSRPEQKIRFGDIVGLDGAKLALKEVMEFMMDSEKFKQRGARMRRGVLLYGPPGTGKTSLAKACANEVGIPFYSANAAQFCEVYVGMGPKKVRQLFAKAKQTAPSVIFIDELDAFGSRSSQNNFMMQSANSEKNSTINQILSQLDGFDTNEKVLVIAATNRLEMVDRSLVRSGRFDLKIQVGLPSMETKIKIFHKYLDKTKNQVSNELICKLLENSQFCSGADIQALVNEAIYLSIRRGSLVVQEQDILDVIRNQIQS